MKKIFLLIIILTLFLSSCSNPNSTIVTSNILTSTPTINPIVSATPENSAMEAYKAVLQNKVNFFSTNDKKNVNLDEYLKDGMGSGYSYKLTRFTKLDMDGDNIPEVVLELQIGGAGFFEILHYMNGVVYGYNVVYRGLEDLKTDGTSWGSSGAADNSCNKMRFSKVGYEYDVLGYSKSSQNKEGFTVSYFIDKKPVKAEAFESFVKEQDEKKDAVWYEFSEKNIEVVLSDLTQPTNSSEDESSKIVDLMKNYEELLPKAINANDFSLVESCLLKESSLYESQNKLVANLFAQGIKERVVSHDIVRIEFEGKDQYKVLTVESIAINYPQKGEEIKEFHWIYTANKVDNNIKLSNIEEWKDFDKFMQTAMSSVKVDGYYSGNFVYGEYDNLLVDKLNKGNSAGLDKALENKAVMQKHDAIINGLRNLGHDFTLVKSSVLENTGGEPPVKPYKVTKKITFNFVDKNSNKKEVSLIITFVITERRTGYKDLFGGYAIITEIMDYKIE